MKWDSVTFSLLSTVGGIGHQYVHFMYVPFSFILLFFRIEIK